MAITIQKEEIVVPQKLLDGLEALNVALSRNVISEDEALIWSFLSKYGVESKDAAIISLIFGNTNISAYLNREELSEVEVNNIFTAICKNCGLSPLTSQFYLNAILKGFGFHAVVDYQTNQSKLEKNCNQGGFQYDLTGTKYAEELKKIEAAIDNKNEYFFSLQENTVLFSKMLSEHNAYALFLFGRCCIEGIGTVKDDEKAFQYISEAANAGLPEANAYLGGLYFKKKKFTKAFEHYTAIGAVALSPDRKENLSAILSFEKPRKKTFVLSLVISVLNVLYFLFMMLHGFSSVNSGGASSVVLPVIGIILTVIMTCLLLLFHKQAEFDSVGQYIVGLLAITASITVLFLLF